MSEYIIAKDNEDWLALRKQGIGGSDVGTILGVNPYKSPFQLWAEKTGQVEAEDLSDKIPIIIGHELEETVARLFEKETGLKVRKDNKTYFHKDYPFLLANVDRQIVGKKAILECKTTSVYNEKQWIDDEVPASYLLQVQHYLDVLDYDVAYIAVLIGNRKFLWKEIARDDELIKIMHSTLIPFWETNVMQNIPPKIDGTTASSDYLSKKYSEALNTFENNEILSKQQSDDVAFIKECDAMIKDITVKKEEAVNRIKLFMGENEVSRLNNEQYDVSWKSQSRTTVNSKLLKENYPEVYKNVTKTTNSQIFRIKELKGDGN